MINTDRIAEEMKHKEVKHPGECQIICPHYSHAGNSFWYPACFQHCNINKKYYSKKQIPKAGDVRV